jgi:hypothetical protein
MLGLLRWFALVVVCMAVPTVHAQATFDIALDSTRKGTIPTEDIDHVYLLNLPAGAPDVPIRVDPGGDWAAVGRGPRQFTTSEDDTMTGTPTDVDTAVEERLDALGYL